MSVDIYAFWKGELTADKSALKKALLDLGFEASVLHEPTDNGGFWPIDLDGLRTGVCFDELSGPDVLEVLEDFAGAMATLGSRDHGALFSFGGNAAEAGTAMALAAALGKLVDAVIFDPQDGEFLSIPDSVASAKRFFDEARREGAQQRED